MQRKIILSVIILLLLPIVSFAATPAESINTAATQTVNLAPNNIALTRTFNIDVTLKEYNDFFQMQLNSLPAMAADNAKRVESIFAQLRSCSSGSNAVALPMGNQHILPISINIDGIQNQQCVINVKLENTENVPANYMNCEFPSDSLVLFSDAMAAQYAKMINNVFLEGTKNEFRSDAIGDLLVKKCVLQVK